uniref:Glycosyltransferase n=1 Tax=Panagrolaimus superbus TaxID=310955 RepID=A0A914YT51_9BILA
MSLLFQRHCITINVLRDNPELEYLLFLDADMGIINPNHLIEEYINPKFDLTFYERIFNFEVMAGSYIVKNTPYSITFLKDWIEYEKKLPESFHGTDNAAIHQILVDWYNPNDKRDIKCREIWEESIDWDGVWKYVGCARSILNNTLDFDRIKIISKLSHLTWSRDGWLTNSHWSPTDFIFHGWQKRRLQKITFAGWFNPLIDDEPFLLQRCHSGRANLNWRYKDTFIKNDNEIFQKLDKISNEIRVKYKKIVAKIWA